MQPQDPKAEETESIKAALYQMLPQLQALDGLTKEQLQEVLSAANAARSTSQASWERHATSMMNDLDAEASKVLDTDKLTPTQQKNLRRAYRDEALMAVEDRKRAVQRGDRETLDTLPSDNDFVARHERGDKTLLKEFVTTFLNDWFEPARRSVTANQARRGMRPVPRGERTRQPIVQGEAKIDYNDNTAFKKALIDARASGGRE